MSWSIHPAAELFPMMSDAEIEDLAEDIKTHGLVHAIVLFEDRVLDGRNRLTACERIGIEPKTKVLKSCSSPTAYVISANRKRRQLTPVQCAAHAVDPRVLESFKAEADARKLEGQRSGGRGHKKLPSESGGEFSERTKHKSAGEAVARAAEAWGIGRDAAYSMAKIRDEAPETYEAAKQGKFKSVAAAVRAATDETDDTHIPIKRARRDKLDAQVRALHEEEHLGATEIAHRLRCSTTRVHDAKRRLGLVVRDENPLRRLTNYAIEFCDTWEIALATDESQWEGATSEQITELTSQLKKLQQKTTALIRRLNKEAKGDSHERIQETAS